MRGVYTRSMHGACRNLSKSHLYAIIYSQFIEFAMRRDGTRYTLMIAR